MRRTQVWQLRWFLPMACAIAPMCAPGGIAHADAPAAGLVPGALRALMPGPLDYTFLWWAHGWRGRSPQGRKILCIQTGRYGLALDTERVALQNLGRIARARRYEDAARQDNRVVTALPAASLDLRIACGGKVYRCVRSVAEPDDYLGYPARIVESGRFVQRMVVDHLVFEDAAHQALPVRARLEIVAWPDRVAFLLAANPTRDLPDGAPAVALERAAEGGGRARSVVQSTGSARAGGSAAPGAWAAGESRSAWVAAPFGPDAAGESDGVSVRCGPAAGEGDTPAAYDPVRGWHRIALPPETWTAEGGDHIAHLERARITLANTTGGVRQARVLFAKDYGFPGVTGFAPMLRDLDGVPTGIPVQLSKNWHRTPGRPLTYEGPWFHGFTVITLPAHSRTTLEFDLAYGHWGSVPVASHAQLCLIGYGGNQLWEQAAIGSWGESICYDPDVNLGRAVIDDVRPLMVWQMNSDRARWGWTNNAGGGDFLVLHDAQGRKQHLSRMRTAYLSHGPCLTHVVYAGETAGGGIAARIDVRLPRTDDCVHALQRFRYDVRRRTPFTRLAFYQVGADRYNDPRFDRLAIGSAAGLTEEWSFPKGGLRYHRTGVPLAGPNPWISLHAGLNPDPRAGGYASRGLVVRRWRARLGGRDVPEPIAAFFGTMDGNVPGMNAELAPPPDLHELLPGDYVEAEVELLVIPLTAGEYYGPNAPFQRALQAGANTWRPVLRAASLGAVEARVRRGRLESGWPVVVRAGRDGASVDLTGGLAYVPVTFTGLRDCRGWEVRQTSGGVASILDQSVHGRDFWQADYDTHAGTWSLTFNIPVDTPSDTRRTVALELRRAAAGAGEGGVR